MPKLECAYTLILLKNASILHFSSLELHLACSCSFSQSRDTQFFQDPARASQHGWVPYWGRCWDMIQWRTCWLTLDLKRCIITPCILTRGSTTSCSISSGRLAHGSGQRYLLASMEAGNGFITDRCNSLLDMMHEWGLCSVSGVLWCEYGSNLQSAKSFPFLNPPKVCHIFFECVLQVSFITKAKLWHLMWTMLQEGWQYIVI